MWCFPFCAEPFSPEVARRRKLEWLKMMRDSMEARLAALNAAIETMERQSQQGQG